MEVRFALLQGLCQCYIILFFSNIVLISGCSNETEPMIIPDVSDEQTTDSAVVIIISEESPELAAKFQELQDMFAPPFLDEGFKTLHEMSESESYLKFLSTAHPNVPHQNLNTFFKNSHPNAERTKVYKRVVEKHFGKATLQDIRAVHHLHRAYQSTRILVYHGTNPRAAIDEMFVPILRDGPGWKWVEKLFPKDEDAFEAFDIEFQQLSRDIESANIDKINQSVQEHDRKGNPDAAFIWFLLTDPVLMGQILQDFTDTDIFHKWLKGEFIANPVIIPTH